MEILLGLSKALAWPLVVFFGLLYYRRAVTSLLSQSKVKFTISGITVETTLTELERSVSESLRGEEFTKEQWAHLKRIRDEGRVAYNHHSDYTHLVSLRNAGLIREHPKGQLTAAKEVSITTLGRLLADADYLARQKRSLSGTPSI